MTDKELKVLIKWAKKNDDDDCPPGRSFNDDNCLINKCDEACEKCCISVYRAAFLDLYKEKLKADRKFQYLISKLPQSWTGNVCPPNATDKDCNKFNGKCPKCWDICWVDVDVDVDND